MTKYGIVLDGQSCILKAKFIRIFYFRPLQQFNSKRNRNDNLTKKRRITVKIYQ